MITSRELTRYTFQAYRFIQNDHPKRKIEKPFPYGKTSNSVSESENSVREVENHVLVKLIF
jgi:hypothetical protein